jgi:hypothetical protein
MAKQGLRLIPGSHAIVHATMAAFASNDASGTKPATVALADGKVVSVNLLFVTSRATGTKSDGLTLINSGTAGTGTTVMGTFLASKAYASYKPVTMTLASAPTFTAGQCLSLAWASTATSGTTFEACTAVLELQYT